MSHSLPSGLLPLSKAFAVRLGLMLEAELINYKYYVPWCDEVILREDAPPDWILELTAEKYQPNAVRIVYAYAYSPPFIALVGTTDFYIACLLKKYRIRQISWATFLQEAGRYTDAYQDSVDCEYFFYMLNDLEDAEFDRHIESVQAEDVASRFAHGIGEVEALYRFFLSYFKERKSAKPE